MQNAPFTTGKLLSLTLLAWLLAGCSGRSTAAPGEGKADRPALAPLEEPVTVENPVIKSEEEWREILDEKRFRILRQKGTERPYSGEYWDAKEAGTYLCAACGLPLFSSETKFESGTGWPSFWQPVAAEHVGEEVDRSHGMVRTEILCERCGGHLGHVFPDGPEPTGLRYCVNSASLVFQPKP